MGRVKKPRHATMETPPPPCSWTEKPKCRRHSTADEYRNDDNGGPPSCTSQQQHQQAEAIPTTPSQEATDAEITFPYLPEGVLQHIHSQMKLRDAARAACVSRSFLHFWRHYPNLQFTKKTLAASKQLLLDNKQSRGKYIFSKARQVLKDHSGTGVRRIKLNLMTYSTADIDTGLLDGWLQACFAIKPAIAEFALLLPNSYASQYSFPYSLLLSDDDVADTDSCTSTSSSIQSLHLSSCGFHPTPNDIPRRRLTCSRSLSRVRLNNVGITGDELWLFLSSCSSLEQLDLSRCNMVASLRIPRVLRKLKVVCVRYCRAMAAVESDAPNLSTLRCEGLPLCRFTLGDLLETKEMDVYSTRTSMQVLLQYVSSNLPSIVPNLESLMLSTDHKILKSPAITDRFKNLKHLDICIGKYGGFYQGYDFLSLACFLDACVALETFVLRIGDALGRYSYHCSNLEKPYEIPSQSSRLEIPGIRYGGLGNLKKATITGFCTINSLIELTRHILERAPLSLQCLALDVTHGYDMKRSSSDRCPPILWHTRALWYNKKILTCVRKYIEPKVPIGIKLKVLGPCSRCHS